MKEKLLTLPSLPGVYLFKDKDQQVIYIGKAKSLKDRVKSYFQKNTDWKVKALIQEAHDLDYVVTNTEIEAMLFEADLISQHKPKYNVLLKSGQPFVYLLFTKDSLPQLKTVRNKRQKGTYFGPFLHKAQARAVAKFLTETFKLRICNKRIDQGCLEYHIDLCAGSCKQDFNPQEYLFRVELAQNALRKNHDQFLKQLHKRIALYAAELNFEKAKHLHSFITNLDTIFNTLHVKYAHDKFHPDFFIATHEVKRIAHYETLAAQLQQLLKSEKPIVSIDCFDISHFQSSYIVGSAVRFCNGFPNKNSFRRFKIRSLKEQNDYAALQEIVTRRYRNAQDLPDLILIDGGKGQLSAIQDLFSQTICVSLAKKEERLYTSHHPDGLPLEVSTPLGKLFISLRDYAHHFAISYHKLLRNKNMDTNK